MQEDDRLRLEIDKMAQDFGMAKQCGKDEGLIQAIRYDTRTLFVHGNKDPHQHDNFCFVYMIMTCVYL